MIWLYALICAVLYIVLMLSDDGSPKTRSFAIISLILLGIAGGFYFGGGGNSDEGCQRYSSFASDC